MPMLADDYGLYYNKKLLSDAGFSAPPKTASELTAMAKSSTVRNPDGTIKVAGFVPLAGFYENAAAHYAPSWGADVVQGGRHVQHRYRPRLGRRG